MSGPATFKAAFTGLDPSAIPGAPPQLSGRISAEAEVSAASADLGALNGQITFQELDVAFSGLNLAQQQPSTIAIASGAATVEQLNLSGSAGEIHACGSVGLVDDRALNVNVDGSLNVAAASLLTDQIRAEGDSTLKLVARGHDRRTRGDGHGRRDECARRERRAERRGREHQRSPQSRGSADRPDAARRRRERRHAQRLWRHHARRGHAERRQPRDYVANDIAYDAPLDLRSISDSDIRITKNGDEIVVSGQVTIDEAGLTGDVNFDTGLLAAMTARRKLDLTEERNPLLERVRFNVDVNTATPILVDNNLARAEIESRPHRRRHAVRNGASGRADAARRLGDSAERTAVRGRARRHDVRGRTAHLPVVRSALNTTAGTYDITIAVTGTPGDTETTLTSDPVAARARHHGHARHRPHARRHARRRIRGRPRAGALVSGRTRRLEPRPWASAGNRPQRSQNRADAHRATKPTRARGSPSARS